MPTALTRLTLVLGLAAFMTSAATTLAWAGDERDIPRLVSFGGSCASC